MANYPISLLCRAGLVLILAKIGHFWRIFFLASESSQWTKLMLHTTYITLGIDNKLLKLYYPYITPYFWLKTTIFWFLMTNYPISLLCRAGLVLILAKIGHFWRIFFLASESSQWTNLMLHTTYIILGIANKLLKLYYQYISPYFWLETTIFWCLMTNYPITLL